MSRNPSVGSLRQPVHLAKRFFGSLSSASPSFNDDQWIRSHLNIRELLLWDRMEAADQRHAVVVARAVAVSLPDADPSVIAAAVLHDIGKVVANLGTFGRVFATVFWSGLPADAGYRWAKKWSGKEGLGEVPFVARLSQYRRHPELGAELLRLAGSAPLTIDWAQQHHRRPERWTVDPDIGRVLKDCDDD